MSKKTLNRVLIAGVAIIWGLVVFRFVLSFFASGKDTAVPEDLSLESSELNLPILSRDTTTLQPLPLSRDPFFFGMPKVVVKQPANPLADADRRPAGINYRIGGIICNDKRKVVILEDLSFNTTVFLRKSDKYKNLKILSITKDQVEIDEGGRKVKHNLATK